MIVYVYIMNLFVMLTHVLSYAAICIGIYLLLEHAQHCVHVLVYSSPSSMFAMT